MSGVAEDYGNGGAPTRGAPAVVLYSSPSEEAPVSRAGMSILLAMLAINVAALFFGYQFLAPDGAVARMLRALPIVETYQEMRSWSESIFPQAGYVVDLYFLSAFLGLCHTLQALFFDVRLFSDAPVATTVAPAQEIFFEPPQPSSQKDTPRQDWGEEDVGLPSVVAPPVPLKAAQRSERRGKTFIAELRGTAQALVVPGYLPAVFALTMLATPLMLVRDRAQFGRVALIASAPLIWPLLILLASVAAYVAGEFLGSWLR